MAASSQQPQQNQSSPPSTSAQTTPGGTGNVTFEVSDGNGGTREVIRLTPDGEIYINGTLVDTSRDVQLVIDGLKFWTGTANGIDKAEEMYKASAEFKDLTDKILQSFAGEPIMSAELASAALLAAKMNEENIKKISACDHPAHARYAAGGGKIGCYKCSHEWKD